MEWISLIKKALNFMETELLTIKSPEEVAQHVHISTMYLQKGFQILTGYSIGEYLKNRKLYLAAMDMINTNEKIIDIAYKYGYETPESFTKAFTRFHKATPTEIRKRKTNIRTFLPLRVTMVIQGGYNMDYTIEKMPSFKLIGFSKEFSFDTSYNEIPKFWD
ncbi:MAG TPA: AraC family transcriptional regulator, partial [Haloplasmataceae bacterium]